MTGRGDEPAGALRSDRMSLHPGPRLVLCVGFVIALGVLIWEITSGRGSLLVWLVLLPATTLLGLLVFAHQRVEVTATEVVFAWFPLYRHRVPIDEIAEVRVVEVRPMRLGGWGLRVHARGVALANRGGAGLSVRSTSGNTTIVTVERPERYVAALAARGAPTR